MYEAVKITSLDGNLIGYGIKGDSPIKLQTTNFYTEKEQDKLQEVLGRLNKTDDLLEVWPDARDPEVLYLLNDKEFLPLRYTLGEVVDDKKSTYVYIGDPAEKSIDFDHSNIVFTQAVVPVDPSEVGERIKAACKIVAERRVKGLKNSEKPAIVS